MNLVQFQCQICKAEFWLVTRPGLVSCPNPDCKFEWAPHRAIAVLERGMIIEFQPLNVGPKIQLPKD